MDLRKIRLEEIGKKKITIGKVAENLRTGIGFDCAEIFAEYPDALPALTVISPKGASYPALVQRHGDIVLWEIRDSDLTAAGTGEIQLSFVYGAVVAKSYTGQIEVIRSIPSTGDTPPDPIEEWETEANAKLAEVAQALVDIPEAIDNALEAAKESGEFDGPPGQDGRDGQDGAPGYTPQKGVDYFDGQDGYTPVKGVDYFDGQDGQDGAPGADGVSPTVTVTDITGGHHVVITDADGDHEFDVMDGTTPVQKDWELIREITTTQDETQVWITTDNYGETFQLTDLICSFEAGVSTTGNRDAFYGQVDYVDAVTGNDQHTSIPSLTYPTATSALGARIEMSVNEGKAPIMVRAVAATGDGNTQNLQAMAKTQLATCITGIKIYQSASNKSLIPSGSTVKLYGRRKAS